MADDDLVIDGAGAEIARSCFFLSVRRRVDEPASAGTATGAPLEQHDKHKISPSSRHAGPTTHTHTHTEREREREISFGHT
jgi:hypothetical protein